MSNRNQWKQRGYLTKPLKGIFFTFFGLFCNINVAKSLSWAVTESNGHLRTLYFAISRVSRIHGDKEIHIASIIIGPFALIVGKLNTR